MNAEEWRVVELAPKYEVSNLGRVRRAVTYYKHTGKGAVLNPKVCKQGYSIVTLYTDEGPKHLRVNRLVCWAFNGPPPFVGALACHSDDDPANNLPDNLYWGTRDDNAKDALKNGRYRRGASFPRSKLTEDQVLEMRRVRQEQNISFKSLGAMFGISKAQAAKIINRDLWTHLP